VVVDCSHGNSNKDYTRQSEVARVLAEQIAKGQKGIAGIMLESHLVAGRQNYESEKSGTYGQSITDACIDLTATEAIFEMLASAVQKRRT
jgi:3-deoxy-7-phosphoheptulonate synthase